MNSARREEIDGLTYWTVAPAPVGRGARARVHLLPIYDEYLVAYRDLDAVPRHTAAFGVLPQALVVDGEVAGTWKSTPHKDGYLLNVTASKRLIETERPGLVRAVSRYARFLEKPVTLANA